MESNDVCCETKRGRVITVKGQMATVEIEKDFACSGCNACVFAGARKIEMSALNKIGAMPGDTVLVQPPPKKPIAAFLILLFIPLVLFVATLCVVSVAIKSELIAFVISIGVTIFGFLFVLVLDRVFVSKRFCVKIIACQEDL